MARISGWGVELTPSTAKKLENRGFKLLKTHGSAPHLHFFCQKTAPRLSWSGWSE